MKKPSQPGTAIALRSETQNTERLEIRTLDEIAAGQYWRALKHIKKKKQTFGRRKGKEWITDGRNPVPAGLVLLIKSLRFVDGELHTVILAPHPLELGIEADGDLGHDPEDRRFLRDEFFELFEREFDPAGVRGQEIARIEADIAALQKGLIEGPKDLPQLNAQAPLPTMNALIAHASRADEIRKGAENAVALSQQRATWIQARVEDLGVSTQKIANFHKEQASAALAQVEDTLRYVEHLDSGIRTLGLYTGKDVHVIELAKGAPASADEKLTLFQKKLYMDEELMIHLEDGGADHQDLEHFSDALQQDPKLVERILPMPRSVVIMQYRRHHKKYYPTDGAGDVTANIIANAHLNQDNERTFLLIRNGENIHQVWSEISTDEARRLFPTQEDVASIYKRGSGFFRGLDSSDITPESLLYSDARDDHEKVALFYKRLLVLLWGLNDRLNLFSAFYDRAKHKSWLSGDFQKNAFRFVHDDENVIGDGRPSFRDFIKAKNAMIQAGSRVVCKWKDIVDPDNAPGIGKWDYAARNGPQPIFRWKWKERIGITVLKTKGQELVGSVACRYAGWRDVEKSDRQIAVHFRGILKHNPSEPGMLCLDGIRSKDLDYYMNSRRHREHYLGYMSLFIQARNFLRQEEEQAAPFIAAVKAGLDAAGISDKVTADQIDLAIEDSIRLWRANRFGHAVPKPGDKEWKEALKEIGAQLYRLIGLEGDRSEIVEAALAAAGRKALRLISSGKGKLQVYATPSESEAFDCGTHFPWAARIDVVAGKAGITLSDSKMVVMPLDSPSEHVLKEWESAKTWLQARPKPYTIGHASVHAFRDEDMKDHALAEEMLGTRRTFEEEEFDPLLRRLRFMTREFSKNRFVVQPLVYAPIAAYAVAGLPNQPQERIHILTVAGLLSNILWLRGTADMKLEIEHNFLRNHYGHPEHALKHLQDLDAPESGDGWIKFSLASITRSVATKSELKDGYIGGYPPGDGLIWPVTGGSFTDIVLSLCRKQVHREDKAKVKVRDLGWSPTGMALAETIIKTWRRPGEDDN